MVTREKILLRAIKAKLKNEGVRSLRTSKPSQIKKALSRTVTPNKLTKIALAERRRMLRKS